MIYSLKINELVISKEIIILNTSSLIPEFYMEKRDENGFKNERSMIQPISQNYLNLFIEPINESIEKVLEGIKLKLEDKSSEEIEHLKNLLHRESLDKIKRNNLIRTILFDDKEKNESKGLYNEIISLVEEKMENKNELKLANFMIGFDDLCEAINSHLTDYYKRVIYIAPIRASVERYYRIQGVAIEEIDPQGNNIAMFLKNFNENSQERFAKWCKENFNFKVLVEEIQGHAKLIIEYSENNRLNLIDTGFGYSQLLPIILGLFNIENRLINEPRFANKVRDLVIVIEQPELHLHPAMQCQLIDVFIKLSNKFRDFGVDLKIIIETHSESIINRVGSNIVKDRIANEDVCIYLFENGNLNTKSTKIKKLNFDEDGIVLDWPLDFFYPEV